MLTNGSILKVTNLKTRFFTRRGVVKAVDGVNFELKRGECLCLVGESGCGKSVTVLSILGLIDSPPGKIVDGEASITIWIYSNVRMKELRRIRGKEIAMIFQDAQSALNPVFTMGDQIIEQIKLHLKDGRDVRLERKPLTLLEEMGIPSAERAYGQLSSPVVWWHETESDDSHEPIL